MDARQPDLLKPTLISGLVFGLASAIPFLNLVNICCCALVWGCGLLAAYLYSTACKAAGVAFRPGTGALVGLMAGAFYAVSATVFSTVFSLLFGPAIAEMAARMVERLPEVPPFAMEALEKAQQEAGKFSVVSFILGLFFWILCGAVFSTLGGLLGGALFKHEPPPPPPPAADWGGMPPAGP
jgi:hypothetical protein